MSAFAKTKIRGCIFGLDGVVANTARYHYVAWQRLANEMGFDFEESRMEEMRSLSRLECLEKILEWGGLYMTEAEKLFWSDLKNNWYVELIAGIRPNDVFPGVLPFLEQLRAVGLKTALTSASRNAKSVLRLLQIEPYFDVVVDGENTRKGKPDPECYLLTAHALGLAPASCLIFEDGRNGILAARRGGFPVVGVGQPRLLEKADSVIPGFSNFHFSDFEAWFAFQTQEQRVQKMTVF